jgi:hypothetical protein
VYGDDWVEELQVTYMWDGVGGLVLGSIGIFGKAKILFSSSKPVRVTEPGNKNAQLHCNSMPGWRHLL